MKIYSNSKQSPLHSEVLKKGENRSKGFFAYYKVNFTPKVGSSKKNFYVVRLNLFDRAIKGLSELWQKLKSRVKHETFSIEAFNQRFF